jgi:hypothetical protein
VENSNQREEWIDPETGEVLILIDREEQLALLYEYVETLQPGIRGDMVSTAMGRHYRDCGHRLAPGCCRDAQAPVTL